MRAPFNRPAKFAQDLTSNVSHVSGARTHELVLMFLESLLEMVDFRHHSTFGRKQFLREALFAVPYEGGILEHGRLRLQERSFLVGIRFTLLQEIVQLPYRCRQGTVKPVYFCFDLFPRYVLLGQSGIRRRHVDDGRSISQSRGDSSPLQCAARRSSERAKMRHFCLLGGDGTCHPSCMLSMSAD